MTVPDVLLCGDHPAIAEWRREQSATPQQAATKTRNPTMKNKLIALVEGADAKSDLPTLTVGDTVDVHQRILEGKKERVQVFSGT